jgi:hypothetical protein
MAGGGHPYRGPVGVERVIRTLLQRERRKGGFHHGDTENTEGAQSFPVEIVGVGRAIGRLGRLPIPRPLRPSPPAPLPILGEGARGGPVRGGYDQGSVKS